MRPATPIAPSWPRSPTLLRARRSRARGSHGGVSRTSFKSLAMNIANGFRHFAEPEPVPPGPIRLGSPEHRALFCQTMLDTHDPYKPALIDWPKLEPDTRDKIVSLP